MKKFVSLVRLELRYAFTSFWSILYLGMAVFYYLLVADTATYTGYLYSFRYQVMLVIMAIYAFYFLQVINREITDDSQDLIWTLPYQKKEYLLGKLTGAYLFSLLGTGLILFTGFFHYILTHGFNRAILLETRYHLLEVAVIFIPVMGFLAAFIGWTVQKKFIAYGILVLIWAGTMAIPLQTIGFLTGLKIFDPLGIQNQAFSFYLGLETGVLYYTSRHFTFILGIIFFLLLYYLYQKGREKEKKGILLLAILLFVISLVPGVHYYQEKERQWAFYHREVDKTQLEIENYPTISPASYEINLQLDLSKNNLLADVTLDFPEQKVLEKGILPLTLHSSLKVEKIYDHLGNQISFTCKGNWVYVELTEVPSSLRLLYSGTFNHWRRLSSKNEVVLCETIQPKLVYLTAETAWFPLPGNQRLFQPLDVDYGQYHYQRNFLVHNQLLLPKADFTVHIQDQDQLQYVLPDLQVIDDTKSIFHGRTNIHNLSLIGAKFQVSKTDQLRLYLLHDHSTEIITRYIEKNLEFVQKFIPDWPREIVVVEIPDYTLMEWDLSGNGNMIRLIEGMSQFAKFENLQTTPDLSYIYPVTEFETAIYRLWWPTRGLFRFMFEYNQHRELAEGLTNFITMLFYREYFSWGRDFYQHQILKIELGQRYVPGDRYVVLFDRILGEIGLEGFARLARRLYPYSQIGMGKNTEDMRGFLMNIPEIKDNQKIQEAIDKYLTGGWPD